MAVPAWQASNSWPVLPAQASPVPATPAMIQMRNSTLMTTMTHVNGLYLGIEASFSGLLIVVEFVHQGKHPVRRLAMRDG